MIAAVLDARGVAYANARIAALADAVGAQPAERLEIGNVALARWEGGLATFLSASSSAVVAGHVRGLGSSREVFPGDDLRGDFALAREDGGRLILLRGHFGGRSLYYTRSADGACVTACSRLTPLSRIASPAPSFDVERLAALASAADAPKADRTLYEGICRVPAGSAVSLGLVGDVRIRTRRLAIDAIESADPYELAVALRARIASSVVRATAGHERVAVLVGGGIDSSALLATTLAEARGASPKEVRALALDLDGGPGDDRPYLRALCDALGIAPLRIGAKDAARFLRDRLVYDGMPVTWPTAPMMTALHSAAAEAGASVVLVGEGGDSLFWGNPDAFAWEARRGHVLRAIRGAMQMRLPYPTSRARLVADLVAKPLVRARVPRALMRRRRLAQVARWRPWSAPVMRAYLRAVVEADVTSIRDVPGESTRVRELACSVGVTESADERSPMELFAGVEVAYPFLDDDIGSLIGAIPSSVLHHDGYARGLFRLAMHPSVPDAIRFRKTKAGFMLGIGDMVQAAGGFEMFRPLVSMTELQRLGLVDAAAYARAFDALVRNPVDETLWLPVWPVLAVEAFLRSPRAPAQVAARSLRPKVITHA